MNPAAKLAEYGALFTRGQMTTVLDTGEAFLSLFEDEPRSKGTLKQRRSLVKEERNEETMKGLKREEKSTLNAPKTSTRKSKNTPKRSAPDVQEERQAFMSSKAAEIHRHKRRRKSVDVAHASIADREDRAQFLEFRRDVEKLGIKGFDKSTSMAFADDKWVALGGQKTPGKAIPMNIGIELWKQKQKEQRPLQRKPKQKKTPSKNKRTLRKTSH